MNLFFLMAVATAAFFALMARNFRSALFFDRRHSLPAFTRMTISLGQAMLKVNSTLFLSLTDIRNLLIQITLVTEKTACPIQPSQSLNESESIYYKT